MSLKLRELCEYREMLVFLTWRDVAVRYKQAALGVAWAILQPLLAKVILA
jgi:lipopolysaccharide transport system permease protein